MNSTSSAWLREQRDQSSSKWAVPEKSHSQRRPSGSDRTSQIFNAYTQHMKGDAEWLLSKPSDDMRQVGRWLMWRDVDHWQEEQHVCSDSQSSVPRRQGHSCLYGRRTPTLESKGSQERTLGARWTYSPTCVWHCRVIRVKMEIQTEVWTSSGSKRALNRKIMPLAGVCILRRKVKRFEDLSVLNSSRKWEVLSLHCVSAIRTKGW